jgi:hypothetical protein
MKNIFKIISAVLLLIYVLVAFIVLPWFLGAIYRHEQSLLFWNEYSIALERYGLFNAILSLILYSIFYSAPFSIVYYLLYKYQNNINLKNRIICSIWASFTFILFLEPMNFVIYYFFNEANFIVSFIWLVFSCIIVYSGWDYFKYLNNNKRE